MITINENKKTKIINDEERYILVEMSGLSTDEKPTVYEDGFKSYIDNGSTFIEMNTGKIYFYDLASTTWVEFGGGVTPTPTPTPTGEVSFTFSKPTFANDEMWGELEMAGYIDKVYIKLNGSTVDSIDTETLWNAESVDTFTLTVEASDSYTLTLDTSALSSTSFVVNFTGTKPSYADSMDGSTVTFTTVPTGTVSIPNLFCDIV